MALTRKFLTALGIESDKVDEIIDAHMETVNGLKAERDENKDFKAKFEDAQAKLDELSKAGDGKDTYKVKYEAIKEEFEAFKAETNTKVLNADKDKAYRALLKEAGVSEKRIDAIMKVTDLSEIEIDEKGLKNADKLTETVKTEWADFITTKEPEGANTQTPPGTEPGTKEAKPLPTIF